MSDIVLPSYLYHVEIFDQAAAQEIEETLNHLGMQGWELVSLTETPLPPDRWLDGSFKHQGYRIRAYFKLKVPDIPIQEHE